MKSEFQCSECMRTVPIATFYVKDMGILYIEGECGHSITGQLSDIIRGRNHSKLSECLEILRAGVTTESRSDGEK